MLILIAEDERITRRKLQRQLEQLGHEVIDAADGAEAWKLFQEHFPPIVVCDWEMPIMNGLELVQHIRAADCPNYVYIVMLTGKSDKEDVVEGIEAGADDFVTKPFDRNELRARLNAGLRIVELEHSLAGANDRLKHELAVARELSNAEHRKHEESLLGESIPVRALRDGIQRFAASDDPLLLTGPAGAGQEAVARAIHRSSPRNDRPFINVACAHIAGVNESLFGFNPDSTHESHFGKVSLADGGTLYLEGFETLSPEAQAELAKFLGVAANSQEKGVRPVPDVRVIAYQSSSSSTDRSSVNEELEQRIGIHRLAVPSLAERREDIAVIAASIVERRARLAGKAIDGLVEGAEEMLCQYSWPGNIRELQNVVERAVVLASGTRVDIPEELLREGRRIGGYTLERKLGSGAMGEVWLAKHSLLARPSAVKLIRQEALRGDITARELLETRFQREAQATAQLRSPHAVELYDFGLMDDGDFYYVMEYLRGIDLESLVHQFGALPPPRVVHFLRQACMSLGEAHGAGLVHRDVKPANLFVCQLGPHYDFLKLLDFGIVRTTSDLNQTVSSGVSATLSSVGQIAGTPTTISPEVVDGKPAGFASDIYGLGCVAYWLLAGRHVFEAPNAMSFMVKHLSQTPEPLSRHASNVPAGLDELVLRCLAKNPTDRPGSAFELAELLEAIPLHAPWNNQMAKAWWSENMHGERQDERLHEQTDSSSETIVMNPDDTE